jgi:hypothetical protein
MYSFHGQCDLIMARSYSFDNGLGLELHARTQIVTDWSLINNAALKIGSDVLELVNDGTYYFNGRSDINLYDVKMADKYPIEYKVEMIDIENEEENGQINTVQEPKVIITIDLGNDHDNKSIQFQLWKHMINVNVDVHLDDTEGMLGIRNKSGMIGRDRETIIVSANEMGFQWQVQDYEPKLFHTGQAPQFPQQCMLPTVDGKSQRRLQKVSEKRANAAKDACGYLPADIVPFCINDVILTGDISLANGYAV